MDPKKGSMFGCFPFRERFAVNEPRPGLHVPRSPGDVVILPWIRGRKPTENILLQLLTCQTIPVIPGSNGNVEEYVLACSFRSQLDEGFLNRSQMEPGRCCERNTPRLSRTPSTDDFPSRKEGIQQTAGYEKAHSLTLHELPHVLNETVDDLESLGCGSPNLILRESVQPLQDRLDVLLPEKFLYKFDFVVLSKVSRPSQREHTHSIVAAGVLWLPKRVWRVAPSLFSPLLRRSEE
jgi:hypothetical protein